MEAGLPIKVLLPFVIAILMFGIGMSLTLGNFVSLKSAPKAAVLGLLNMFVLFPLLAFVLAWALDLPPHLGIGLVLLAACPSGSTSNLFTYLARGDVALSITLTAVSKTLPVLTIPLYVGLASLIFAGEERSLSLRFADISERMVVMVLLPTAAGMALRHFQSGWAQRIRPYVTRIGVVLLIALIAALVWRERNTLPGMMLAAGPATLALCLLGVACAYLTATLFRLADEQRTTLILEICIQSGGTAIAIAAGILGSPALAIPAAVYSLIMYLVATMIVVGKRLRSAAPEAARDSLSG